MNPEFVELAREAVVALRQPHWVEIAELVLGTGGRAQCAVVAASLRRHGTAGVRRTCRESRPARPRRRASDGNSALGSLGLVECWGAGIITVPTEAPCGPPALVFLEASCVIVSREDYTGTVERAYIVTSLDMEVNIYEV